MAFQYINWTDRTGSAHAVTRKPRMNAAGPPRSKMSCLASSNLHSRGWMRRAGVEGRLAADPGRGRKGLHSLVFDRFTRERMRLTAFCRVGFAIQVLWPSWAEISSAIRITSGGDRRRFRCLKFRWTRAGVRIYEEYAQF